MLFSEPLTTFEPTLKQGMKPLRHPIVSVVRCQSPGLQNSHSTSGHSEAAHQVTARSTTGSSTDVVMSENVENGINHSHEVSEQEGNWLELIHIFDGYLDSA